MAKRESILAFLRMQQRATEAVERGRKKRQKATIRPILSGEERRHVIHSVIDMLADWRFSPFQFEGACIHYVRSTFCLEGHGWSSSDHEARSLVSEAFARIGARRPTWEQGQRDYTASEGNCYWCGVGMDAGGRAGHVNKRFCSVICAQSSLRHRHNGTSEGGLVKWSAKRLIQQAKTKPRPCGHCHQDFHPPSEQSGQLFCSSKCRGLHFRTIPQVACMQCGIEFHGKNGKIFCTPVCARDHRRTATYERVCGWCDTSFTTRSATAMFCSKSHLQRARHAKSKRSNVVYLTPKVFDGLFKVGDKFCVNCAKSFRSRVSGARFCSLACANNRPIDQKIAASCICCGQPFLTFGDAQFCGQKCRSKFAQLRSGVWKPIRLSPVVFDFYFTSRSAFKSAFTMDLTPLVFDEWFKLAA